MQRNPPTLRAPSHEFSKARRASRWQRLERGWRIFVTPIDFLVAVTLSLGLSWIVVPVIRLASRDEDLSARRTQWFLHWISAFFLSLLRVTGLFRFELSQAGQLREPGLLVIANHPTFIDALILIAQMPQAYCVVKKNFYRNPFFGPSARAAGYIPIEDGLAMVNTCARHIRKGRSVIIFPEGTRSPADGLGDFQRGAAHVALRSGCAPIPVTIRSHPATLYRNRPWWDVPPRRPTISIHAGEPLRLPPQEHGAKSRSRVARAYTDLMRRYFEKDLEHA